MRKHENTGTPLQQLLTLYPKLCINNTHASVRLSQLASQVYNVNIQQPSRSIIKQKGKERNYPHYPDKALNMAITT